MHTCLKSLVFFFSFFNPSADYRYDHHHHHYGAYDERDSRHRCLKPQKLFFLFLTVLILFFTDNSSSRVHWHQHWQPQQQGLEMHMHLVSLVIFFPSANYKCKCHHHPPWDFNGNWHWQGLRHICISSPWYLFLIFLWHYPGELEIMCSFTGRPVSSL